MKTQVMTADRMVGADLEQQSQLVVSLKATTVGAFAWIRRRLAVSRAYGELAALDDRLLRDIGMQPGDITSLRASRVALPATWN